MSQNIEQGAAELLANDLLRGAAKIGAFIGLGLRETFYGLQEGHIPATKEGKTWVTTKSRLRRHYNEERYEPPPKEEPPPNPVGQARCARPRA